MGRRPVIETSKLIVLLAMVAVPISWLVPAALALDAVALWTAGVLIVLAPTSALWLIGIAALTPLVLRAGDGARSRDLPAAAWAALLLGSFVAARLSPGIVWIGGAFFTLRALHVVGDWWMGRLTTPPLRSHLRYQLFLPVVMSGPIHRFETFERQAQRRRWDKLQFFDGSERALIGAFSAFFIGGWLTQRLGHPLVSAKRGWHPFVQQWAQSVIDWIQLYFVFAGYTSIALGISLMIGLQLEENFDRPWAARNLIEFWTRWHITLTRWCRDYVFRPVTAVSRSALAGLFAAMMAIGLWHEFSLYYVLWALWQATGVVLTRLASRRLPLDQVPAKVRAVAGPLIVLAWLSLARPVILELLRLDQ